MIKIFLIILSFVSSISAISDHPILIVVSYDGFRFDYFDKVNTPYFNFLRETGVTVPYMINAFTTKTFPNHHTIATGLWTESHGIVDNHVYDELLGRNLSVADEDMYRYNDEAIPIWIRNEWAGGNRKSGVIMWAGNLYAYGQNRSIVSHFKPYTENYPFKQRIDDGIDWILKDHNPINLLMIYLDEPDETGHKHGPDSKEILEIVKNQDDLTGYLVDKLKKADLFEKVNLLLVSDYGMTAVNQSGIIHIPRDIQDLFEFRVGESPVWNIMPKEGKTDELYSKLLIFSEENHFYVFKKEDLPTAWNYKNNRRILPIVLVANIGYVFNDWTIIDGVEGVHGYENVYSEMWPFFIAHGPSFKKGFEGDSFTNVNIFPLMSHLLGIPIALNNGSLEDMKQFLVSENEHDSAGIFKCNYLLVALIIIYTVFFRI